MWKERGIVCPHCVRERRRGLCDCLCVSFKRPLWSLMRLQHWLALGCSDCTVIQRFKKGWETCGVKWRQPVYEHEAGVPQATLSESPASRGNGYDSESSTDITPISTQLQVGLLDIGGYNVAVLYRLGEVFNVLIKCLIYWTYIYADQKNKGNT